MSDSEKNLKPNFTAIPNIVIDQWMREVSPAEFKVIVLICRNTYGWHKERDAISLSQIEEVTGLSRKGIINMMTALCRPGGPILQFKSELPSGHRGGATVYALNTEWRGLSLSSGVLSTPEDRGHQCTQYTATSVLSTPLPVYSVHPQKKEQNKEKESVNSSGAGAPSNGTLIANDWLPSKEDVDAVIEAYPVLDREFLKRETLSFVNHFLSAPASKARKRSWSLAWRNWMHSEGKKLTQQRQRDEAFRANQRPSPKAPLTGEAALERTKQMFDDMIDNPGEGGAML